MPGIVLIIKMNKIIWPALGTEDSVMSNYIGKSYRHRSIDECN